MTRVKISKHHAVCALALALAAQPGLAETLEGALVKAYHNNPTLTGARATQRAVDEQVAVELSAGRPQVSAEASLQNRVIRNQPLLTPSRVVTVNGQISVPVYTGGSVRNSIKAARTRAEGGQDNLRGTEAGVYSEVVAAYMDVIRDSAIVSFNKQNVSALKANLRASTQRFKVGDLTRTDVAQSESRLALAESQLQDAEARLIGSKERYVELVGEAPVALQKPAPLAGLPASVEDAVTTAIEKNPDILAARKVQAAARFDVRSARGRVAPRVSGVFAASRVDNLNTLSSIAILSGFQNRTTDAFAGVNVSVPIYQGGLPGALARQATDREAAATERTTEVERGVIAQTRSAFASWRASLASIESNRKAVDSAVLSLESVKTENRAGTRTILDILNAEQEALVARTQLASAERNAFVAAFSLLAAMGQAEARDLRLPLDRYYDSNAHYRTVGSRLFDYAFGDIPDPVATRTNMTQPQSADAEADPVGSKPDPRP
ncbi:TolC family outer membrane protein [Novosphingobium flavum]|uniref:TolC family outer membrane protein n=1 Tax=Novosphingobium aerophilum TaxID=2839843 RepID=UPI00163A8569|nr:TolC family outer membrane protein [Novosphingobium aerophilum]MBC2662456.1 TolC family outer membrane protein [Novosphingobium aerophilum]